jgi:hypothetical protein
MASTQFVDFSQNTPVVAAWLNDVNGVVYNLFGTGGPGAVPFTTVAQVQAKFGIITPVANLAAARQTVAAGGVGYVQTKGFATLNDGGAASYLYTPSAAGYTLAVPGGIVGTPSTTGGVLPTGNRSVRISAVDESGETLASATTTVSITGPTGSVTWNWTAVPGAAAYRCYSGAAGSEQFAIQINQTNWIDDGGVIGNGNPPATPWQWDNNCTRFTFNDGSRWVLMFQGNLCAEQCGVFGDNTTVNTTQLRAAMLALYARGGGFMDFRAGVYLTGPINMWINTGMRGCATDFTGHPFAATPGSSLKLAPGINDNLIYVPLLQRGIRFNDMNLDGNQQGNPTGLDTVHCQTNGTLDTNYYGEDGFLTFENCNISNAKANGVSIGPGQRGMHVRNCYVTLNGGDGLHIFTSDCTIESSLFGINGNAGINLLGAEVTHMTDLDMFVQGGANLQIGASTFFGVGNPVPSNYAICTSCEFDNAGSHGVLVGGNSQGVIFQGCRWNANSLTVFGSGAQLFLDATMTAPTVVNGCMFLDDLHGSPSTAYDIQNQGTGPVFVSNNIHNGNWQIALTNRFDLLRTTGSNINYYTDGQGKTVGTTFVGNVAAGSGLQSQFNNTGATEGSNVLDIAGGGATSASFRTVATNGFNGALAGLFMGRNSTTSRSINAGGTVNASGSDYAEYEVRAVGCGSIAKGQIVGFDAQGLLTDRWQNAVSFAIKSTNPSFVGGDTWGGEHEAGTAEHEAARETVERIAYCGKVPVNVAGALPGDYIVPMPGVDGSITGTAVTEPTFEQYRMAVGKVKNIQEDGRPVVLVKTM